MICYFVGVTWPPTFAKKRMIIMLFLNESLHIKTKCRNLDYHKIGELEKEMENHSHVVFVLSIPAGSKRGCHTGMVHG